MAIRQADDRLPSWQAMDSGRLLLLAAVGMMVVAALARTAAAGHVVQPQTAIAFGSAIAIGELLRLGLPGGREAAPIATAAALAYALLMRVGNLPTVPVPALQVIAVTVCRSTGGAARSGSRQPSRCKAAMNASTRWGSNWLPAPLRSSSIASLIRRASR